MQSICRLRIADFLDEKKIVYRITNFLDRSEQQEIVRIANLKRQLAVITKTEEKVIKKEEEEVGNHIYRFRGYAANDGKRDNSLGGGGNQPLTAKGALNMAKGLKENYNGCDRINFMQVINVINSIVALLHLFSNIQMKAGCGYCEELIMIANHFKLHHLGPECLRIYGIEYRLS